MQLVDVKETYTFVLNVGDGDKNPEFTMKKLTAFEVDRIDDVSTRLSVQKGDEGNNQAIVLAGTTRDMKINYCVVDWTNINEKNGKPAKCTRENKRLLPVSVRAELIKHIDEKNELNPDKEEEEKKAKN